MSTRSPTALEDTGRSRRRCRRSASIVAAPHARKTDTPTKGTACRSMPALPPSPRDGRAVVADLYTRGGKIENVTCTNKKIASYHCCNSPYHYLGDHLLTRSPDVTSHSTAPYLHAPPASHATRRRPALLRIPYQAPPCFSRSIFLSGSSSISISTWLGVRVRVRVRFRVRVRVRVRLRLRVRARVRSSRVRVSSPPPPWRSWPRGSPG